MARTLYDRLNEIKTKHLNPQSVTGDKIANDAIEEKHIKDGVVTKRKIANGIIGTDEIADSSINANKLATNSVTTAKLANGSVSNEKIVDGAITADKIAVNAITTEKIANGAITRDKVADRSVGSDDIVDGAVTNSKIASNAVTASKIAANAVGSSEIAANAVGTSEIANGAVTQEKLAPGVGGDRNVFGTLATPGIQSADVLTLTDIAADIPYTALDLSPWIPANAKGVILQLGMFNQAFTSGRAFFRVRTNVDQRDALGVGLIPGQSSQSANAGLVPLVVGTPSIEYALESVGGPWIGTLTLYITVVGYVV